MTQAVLFEKHGSIGEIILNRPDDLNAMNFDLIEGLAVAVDRCRDAEIRAVVLRGTGRCFCAGGDIKFFQQQINNQELIPEKMPDRLHEMVEALRNLEKPILASVHGAAAGAGAPLVLSCDLAIASEDSIFNFAYARIGLTPDGSSTFFLPRHVGLKKAAELFMMMPTLKAAEARELGLINWVVPASDLQAKTREIAQQLAQGATQAFGRVKKLLNQSHSHNLHEQLALETRMICDSSKTEDFREGVGSFLGKKAPKFIGK